MSTPPADSLTPGSPPARRSRLKALVHGLLGGLLLYFVVAYLILPVAWRRYEKRHPALDGAPRIAHTATGIPGDPINLGLVATEEQIHRALLSAKWFPADPITLESSLRIASSTVFHKSYIDAPVSSLFVWGHKQDLAFEQPVGEDARRRHHVRFWRSEKLDDDGKPLWLGAATFDTRVGFSHTTGEITHHISPDVDSERDKIVADLKQAGAVLEVQWIEGFQEQHVGKNGGGDPYHTDGKLAVVLVGPLPQSP
jgi:LssY C-terminus